MSVKAIPKVHRTEAQREDADRAIESLKSRQEAGHIKSMLFACVSPDGCYAWRVGDEMTVLELAMIVAYLQTDLQDMLRRVPQVETPPAA